VANAVAYQATLHNYDLGYLGADSELARYPMGSTAEGTELLKVGSAGLARPRCPVASQAHQRARRRGLQAIEHQRYKLRQPIVLVTSNRVV
jgi:hypothetical protein